MNPLPNFEPDPIAPFPPAPRTADEARDPFPCARLSMRLQSYRACIAGWRQAEADATPVRGWQAQAYRGGTDTRRLCRGCPAGEARARLLDLDLRPWQRPKREGDTPDGQPDAQVQALLAGMRARELMHRHKPRRRVVEAPPPAPVAPVGARLAGKLAKQARARAAVAAARAKREGRT